jgi:pimeloyl-ACP methyl ester carboxylesterase
MNPVLVVLGLLFGLIGLAVVGLGFWLVWVWFEGASAGALLGWNLATLGLLVGLGALVWSVLGGRWARRSFWRFRREATESLLPPHEGVCHRLERPRGSSIAVEVIGAEGRPTLVLTSGWGPDRTEWYDLAARIDSHYRLVLWDLPGLNESTGPDDNDYSLERMAGDLEAVIEAYGGNGPVVLVGHSIGGMVILTFCRRFPELLAGRVAGLALCFTTYKDPLDTMRGGRLIKWLEWPLVRPILVVATWTSGVWWVLSVLSYLNGNAHKLSRWVGFTGHESPQTVEMVSRYQLKMSPGIIARGALGMISFDETSTLSKIESPTLIVAGDRDWLTSPEASVTMHERIAGSELVVMPRAKHMGLLEYPRRFSELVEGFASRCLAPARADGDA